MNFNIANALLASLGIFRQAQFVTEQSQSSRRNRPRRTVSYGKALQVHFDTVRFEARALKRRLAFANRRG